MDREWGKMDHDGEKWTPHRQICLSTFIVQPSYRYMKNEYSDQFITFITA